MAAKQTGAAAALPAIKTKSGGASRAPSAFKDVPTDILVAMWFMLCCALVFYQVDLLLVFYAFTLSFGASFLARAVAPAGALAAWSNAVVQVAHAALGLLLAALLNVQGQQSEGILDGLYKGRYQATHLLALSSGYCLFNIWDITARSIFRRGPVVWSRMLRHTVLPIWGIAALSRRLYVPVCAFAAPAAAEELAAGALALFSFTPSSTFSSSCSSSGTKVALLTLWWTAFSLRAATHLSLLWRALSGFGFYFGHPGHFGPDSNDFSAIFPVGSDVDRTATRVTALFAWLLVACDAAAIAAAVVPGHEQGVTVAKVSSAAASEADDCCASRTTAGAPAISADFDSLLDERPAGISAGVRGAVFLSEAGGTHDAVEESSPLQQLSAPVAKSVPQTHAKKTAGLKNDSERRKQPPPHLWMIHGRLYDLSSFADSHPGGRWAINLGKGRDCTAMFESYHPFTDKHRLVAAAHAVSWKSAESDEGTGCETASSTAGRSSSSGGAIARARKRSESPATAKDEAEAAVGARRAAELAGNGLDKEPAKEWRLPPAVSESDPFYAALCARVREALVAAGKDPHRKGCLKASPAKLLCYAAVLVLLAVSYPAFVRGRWPGPLLFALAAWLAGSMGHDGSHFAVSSVPLFNYLATIAGMAIISSPFMWLHQHTYAHHSHTNDFSLDPDLHHFRFLRTHPCQKRLKRHSAQAYRLYVFAWYALVVFGEALWLPLRMLVDGTVSGVTEVPNFGYVTAAAQLAHLLAYLAAVVAAPLAAGGGVAAVVGFLAGSGLLFGFFSQVNHLNEDSVGAGTYSTDLAPSEALQAQPSPVVMKAAAAAACASSDASSPCSSSSSSSDGAREDKVTGEPFQPLRPLSQPLKAPKRFESGAEGLRSRSWAAEQVETSNNFCTDSRLWTLLSNGLNFQIEHHLFPGINHEHLHLIQPAVKECCAQFGVRYKSFDTASAILGETVRYYRRLASRD